MKSIINATRTQGVIFVTVFALACLAVAMPAHAADWTDGGGDVTVYPDQYADTGGGVSVYPDQYTNVYPDQYTNVYPDQYSSNAGGYGQTGGYGTTGYSASGYATGYMTGGGYPVASTPSNTNIYSPTNICTGGNVCNHDDHSVVNITNPAPVINNNNVVANYGSSAGTSYSTQQYCQSGYYGTYPNCYYNQQPVVYQRPPVAYNTVAPYVSLSQVPYTGLELGFWGSIAYWGAFILFALFAAYLIAIKRVQNNIAVYLKSLLFGSEEEDTETLAPVAIEPTSAPVAVAPQGDVIDSFIMSQINRARHA